MTGPGPVVTTRASWGRALLLIALLGVLALGTEWPWAALWLAVPVAVALALLLSWRFGAPAVAVVAAAAVGLTVAGSRQGLWVWWIPVATLTGAWMGVREEGEGPSAGQRAWMLAPVLALAALLPWLQPYGDLVGRVDRELLESMRLLAAGGGPAAELEKAANRQPELRHALVTYAIPTVLFLWVAVLTGAGRSLAARGARLLGWPRLSGLRLRDWRLPDGALWTFIAGLALLLSPWSAWAPTGWTLLLNAGLGYCVQGVAVVESLLLARGIPPSVIILTMLFVLLIAWPMFVVATAALGLSDVWLDYRRLEPVSDGDQNPGDH